MTVESIPARQDVVPEHQWDLTPLFNSDEDWETLFKKVEAELEKYAVYQGRLHESAGVLKEALDFHLNFQSRLERLYTYAHLKSDQDKSNSNYLGVHDRALNLMTRAGQRSSFIAPEIQAIPDDVIAAFRGESDLAGYEFYLTKLLRYKPHTLDPATERILAMSQEMAATASQVFGQLDNVDLKFGSLRDEAGQEVELSHGCFMRFLQSRSRELRKKAFHQYYDTYENHQYTVAATLSQSVKKDLFYARVRNFDTCRNGAIFDDDVPGAVYDNLIATVRANQDAMAQYLRLRRKVLGLDRLHFYDTYVPMVSAIDFNMPYEEAEATCVAALAPLGRAYTDVMQQGLAGGWVDRYENRGKRSGAYSSGCYDSPPYILMNYRDDNINSLYTLIHEAGHSMHSYYARKHQPYVDADYTIFVAEVASTFNETLLSRHLLEVYADDAAMQAYIINREIDNIRATLFRQTMFAEFEVLLHERVEQNQPLTVDQIREIYGGLLANYFGEALTIDPHLTLEGMRIPHFYHAFYVYKYATGISAAIALADGLLAKGEKAREAYMSFLKSGGCKFPLEQLETAGVDMRTPQPIQAAINHFAALTAKLEGMI